MPFAKWLACPTCGSGLQETDDGARCAGEGHSFKSRNGILDLVDPTHRVSSEGPGDTLAMAWRRRRWDDLRGPEAPENATYLATIAEHLQAADRVVDLGCGPGSILAWLREREPNAEYLGLDLSWPALEEAQARGVDVARASTRRRLPLQDGSCQLVLRRLAPALPEEIARALAPGGHYIRFTFGHDHWREVYDRLPDLPRARADTLAPEHERLLQLGLDVSEPIHQAGTEDVSKPAVMLALRSNPSAFHLARADLRTLQDLPSSLTTDYAVLVATKPAHPEESASDPRGESGS